MSAACILIRPRRCRRSCAPSRAARAYDRPAYEACLKQSVADVVAPPGRRPASTRQRRRTRQELRRGRIHDRSRLGAREQGGETGGAIGRRSDSGGADNDSDTILFASDAPDPCDRPSDRKTASDRSTTPEKPLVGARWKPRKRLLRRPHVEVRLSRRWRRGSCFPERNDDASRPTRNRFCDRRALQKILGDR